VGHAVDQLIENAACPSEVDAGMQQPLVGGTLDELVQPPALRLASEVGVRVLPHHAARVDRSVPADGNDSFDVAMRGVRDGGFVQPRLVEDAVRVFGEAARAD
jgi:hypothetical protein